MDMFVEERKDYVLSDLSIGPLGSGSDFTPFLQHLGVSVLLVYGMLGLLTSWLDCQHGPELRWYNLRRAIPLSLYL